MGDQPGGDQVASTCDECRCYECGYNTARATLFSSGTMLIECDQCGSTMKWNFSKDATGRIGHLTPKKTLREDA